MPSFKLQALNYELFVSTSRMAACSSGRQRNRKPQQRQAQAKPASIIRQATSSIVMHLRDHDDDSILRAIQSLTTIYDSTYFHLSLHINISAPSTCHYQYPSKLRLHSDSHGTTTTIAAVAAVVTDRTRTRMPFSSPRHQSRTTPTTTTMLAMLASPCPEPKTPR